MKGTENKPVTSVVALATTVEPNVMVTVEESAKFVPETVTVEPTMPEVGFSVIEGPITVREAVPSREPAPTFPVTVRVNAPLGVEPEVSSVSDVIVGAEGLVGKTTGLARVTVVLPGAPVKDRRIVFGKDIVEEPEARLTVTV